MYIYFHIHTNTYNMYKTCIYVQYVYCSIFRPYTYIYYIQFHIHTYTANAGLLMRMCQLQPYPPWPGRKPEETQTALSLACDSWPDSDGHSSLNETLDRQRGSATRRPLRLDSDVLAGSQPQPWPPSVYDSSHHGSNLDREPLRTQQHNTSTQTTL